MPASPLKWASYPNPELANIYPIKRKPSEYSPSVLEDCFVSESQLPCKRVCLLSHHNEKINESQNIFGGGCTMESSEYPTSDTKNGASFPPNLAALQQQQASTVYKQSAGAQAFPAIAQQLPELHQQHAASELMDYIDTQSAMVMNINDDDDGEMNDYTSACDAMDGEGAVDPQQYRAKNTCQEQECFGAEESPTSGTVRCYCRPAWGNLSNSQSFFSDIY
ncbi:uncharacterized protein [Watersipora subatra]|uniref:uncharacterized protein n=1 Tax=Watersipora subatra TaxID=2589382 RepID=UPI00355B1378